jgi:hypothetical protein
MTMPNCEAYRDQMLEHLYDLLDEADKQALQAHLESCAPCQAELARARRQQALLAAAARMEFPDVRFVAPEAPPASGADIPVCQEGEAADRNVCPTVPLVAPLPARRWPRWLAAAVVLLALGGIGGPAAWYGRDYLQTRHLVEAREAEQVRADARLKDLEKELARMPQEQKQRHEEIARALREKQIKIAVTGPASMPIGAPSHYQIETRDLNDRLTDARVEAQVMDGPNKIGKPIAVPRTANGSYRLTLPPDLPIRPGSQPTLVVTAHRGNDSRAELREVLTLTAPVYITHLATDKPMYQPGEKVYFRSLTLDRATLQPAREDFRLVYTLTLPQGQQVVLLQGGNNLVRTDSARGAVLGTDGKPVRGIGCGEYLLPSSAPGGEYVLSVREESNRFPEQQRKFLVNTYQKPRFNKELDFNRTTYGPGDVVVARCKAKTAEGTPLKDTPVLATVQIDGRTYDANGRPSAERLRFRTDAEGVVNVRFTLPAQIERGQASLTVTFHDEPLVRTIPIVLKKLSVEFFPEGGYLVADLPNRVYFQVRTPLGKPAELQGRLLEDGQPLPVVVETAHDDKEPGVNQGLGKFEFTPRAGHRYEVQVEKPLSVPGPFVLPPQETDVVVLSVPQGVVGPNEPIAVTVHSKTKRSLLIGAYCRGRLLASATLDPIHFGEKTTAKAVLRPASGEGGVCRVTVFEVIERPGANRRVLQPVAERLIYRQPAERVDLKIDPDRANYVPRQQAKIGLTATDEKGEPVPALLMVAVVDKSVLTLADEKTYRSMPTHFLLTTEVRKPEDLEYADFLLGPHPRAAETLDLLLGTQGWRRFAEQDPSQFLRDYKEDASRLLMTAGIGQSSETTTDFAAEQDARVDRECAAKTVQLSEQIQEVRKGLREAEDDPTYRAALAALAKYDDFFDKLRRVGAPILGVVLLLTAVALLLVALTRRAGRKLPWYAGVATCAVALLLVAKVQFGIEQPGKPAGRQVARASKATAAKQAEHALAEDVRNMEAAPAVNLAMPEAVEERAAELDVKPGAAAGADFPRAALPLAPGGFGLQGGPPAVAPRAPNAKLPGAVPLPDVAPFGGQPQKVKGDDKADRDFHAVNRFQVAEAEKGKDAAALARPADGKAQLKQADQVAAFELNANPAVMADMAGFGRGAGGGKGMAGGLAGPMAARRFLPREQEQLRKRLREMPPAPLPPLVVREYAHRAPAGTDPAARFDWAETLYWNPVLVLPRDGKADVSFQLCDSTTSFQVAVFAHTPDGRLGSATRPIESRLPFALKLKTPLEVTASDRIDLPLAVANNTDGGRQVLVQLRDHKNLELVNGPSQDELSIGANAATRKFYRFRPTVQEGDVELAVEGRTAGFAPDKVREKFRIVPEGFPIVAARSDLLEGSASHAVTLPATWVKGTLKCRVDVYPSTLADLQKGLDALLREPCGCFEQTSTSNYPNLLILDYLKESDQARPEVERRARDLLARGYAKLTSFECLDSAKNARRGYEWFGGAAPAHEALTAYGLMQFRDMARVCEVDPAMVKRTQEYLLSRRDGKGGFERNPRALDTFGAAPPNITNAYIVWALTEGGKDDDIGKELAALTKQAETSKDPYFLSLVANSLINRGKTASGAALLKKVAEAQKEDGHLDAEQTSITHSSGRDLQIETTALAVLGWLKGNPGEFAQPLRKAIEWIGRQRGGYGGFGSTQSTILALKALIAYTKANKKTAEAGVLQLFVGDKPAGRLDFPAGATDTLTLALPNAEEVLKPGKNAVRVEITGKNAFPYTLTWSYHTLQPVSADKFPVKLETKLAKTEAKEGESVRLTVKVENASGKGQGMAVAIVGLPGGMSLPEDLKQLKEYVRVPEDGSRPLIGAFEIRGRELVLYWRDLAPEQKIEVPIDLVCRVPGEYSGPASRAYLYYTADLKHWVEPLKVIVAAKAE